MKKVLFFFTILFFLSSSAFGFNITDSNNIEKSYFSLSNSNVFVETSQNLTNFSLNYNVNLQNISKIYNLSSCQNLFCSNFSLLSFSNISNFEINLGNISKNIYFDIQNPKFDFLNYTIDKINKKLIFNFNVSDNFNIDKVEVYKKQNSNLIFLQNLTNKTSFEVPLTKSENLIYDFKVTDLVGNTQNIEKIIFIDDIFEPTILSNFLSLENNNYKFKFTISDSQLSKYEISQKNVTISELISGTSFNKELAIPFTTGLINFKVIDSNSNIKSINLSLTSPFVNTFNNKFSNQKVFKFNSNAQICNLIDIDSKLVNQNFVKSSDEFSINLDINQVKNYKLKISCSNSNFKETFIKDFYFDNINPSLSNLSIEKLNSGNLKLSWDKSFDNQSSVTYKLYRDGSKIYSGNNLNFEDISVKYPTSYTYYLEILDEATNLVKTNISKMIPKKIIINFEATNLVSGKIVDNKKLNFVVNTDKNSSINIVQNFFDKIISNKTINTNLSNYSNIQLDLVEGVNDIIIRVEDQFGNVKEERYNLIYEPKVLVVPKKVQKKVDPVISKPIEKIQKTNTTNLNKVNSSNNSPNFWIWFSFWILVFALFIWYFILNEERLKEKLSRLNTNKKMDLIKGRNKSNFILSGKFDSHLDKSLDKIKSSRAKKQAEIKAKIIRDEIKSKKVLSSFEKKKMEDLSCSSPKKDILFSINQRSKIKKRTDKLKKKSNYGSDLKKKIDFNFNDFFKSKLNEFSSKKENKNDNFTNYINKKRSENSWSNTSQYLMKTKLLKEKLESDKLNKIQKEKDEKLRKQNEIREDNHRRFEEKEERRLLKEKLKLEKLEAKNSLNEYLGNRTKKRKWFFAEKDVNRDLKNRK